MRKVAFDLKAGDLLKMAGISAVPDQDDARDFIAQVYGDRIADQVVATRKCPYPQPPSAGVCPECGSDGEILAGSGIRVEALARRKTALQVSI